MNKISTALAFSLAVASGQVSADTNQVSRVAQICSEAGQNALYRIQKEEMYVCKDAPTCSSKNAVRIGFNVMNRCLAVYAQKSPQALELAIHSAEIASARWDKYPANSLDKKMGYDHKDASAKLELELGHPQKILEVIKK